ncbi:beta/gamma crystallin domain-containing protein [Yersinia canariae]|uniref:beta/gamma crystallin domain-containing protein n=1 Tax=Yersinia canariae TaxID=2607663 RepID=UPI00119EFB5B|nr:beta/gamma crystallin domain-containing protein [Yersinia canariae]
MKKSLLLYFLVIFHSNNVKANHFYPEEPIEEPLYFQKKESAPACFYAEDNFQGESFCLTAPEAIDLYNIKHSHLNDRISSIKIPEDVQVTIYKNDNFNPPNYTLTESVDLEWLKKIDMAGQISAVTTQNSPGLCTQDCIVIKESKIDLNNIFWKYNSEFSKTNKLILLNVDINNESNFSMGFVHYPQVIVVGKSLFFYAEEKSEPLNMRISDNADNLSFLFGLNNKNASFQYLEAKGTVPLNTPFWINTQNLSEDLADLYITNGIPDNDQGNMPENIQPLIVNKTIMAINKHSHRDRRGALGTVGCFGIPLLAIYNLVVQGRCNQLDKLVGADEFSHHDGEGKTRVVAGSAKPLPTVKHTTSTPLDKPTPAMLILTRLDTHLHNQAVTLPAVAKICKTSTEEILSARYPRQTGMRCGSRLSILLADFTFLFGENLLDWTTEHLTQVLQNIRDHGTTGYAGSDQVTESRLVEGVQEAISDLGLIPLTIMLEEAFNYALLNYARYFMHNENQDTFATPQAAQSLPLGDYVLSLETYIPPTERPSPLIRDNNEWFRPEGLYFEIAVIPGGDQHIATNLTEEIIEVINDWRQFYSQVEYQADNNGTPLTSHDRTIYAAKITSKMLYHMLMDNSADYQFVVVKLKGKIVSILASLNDANNEDSYINFSVTHPQYVLNPDENGSVRGAGTAAVRELARYLKEKGKKTLSSNVISQPSAIVKKKLGFIHKDEF